MTIKKQIETGKRRRGESVRVLRFSVSPIQFTTTMVKLSANENFYGYSPLVKQAIEANLHAVPLYPDNNQTALKEKLAAKWKTSPQNILLGVGSVGIIDDIIQFLVKRDEEMITFERSFIAYGQLAAIHQRKCHFAKLTDFACDAENVFPLINPKTKVIFISNPNNPTGTILSKDSLLALLKKIPSSIFVVVDEAYYEYVTDENYPDVIQLQKEFPNLIVLRSFSKIYGLAGLRLGFGIAEEKTAALLDKSRLPFSVNTLASVAAIAALDDEKFIADCVKKNAEVRDFLFRELKALGFTVLPSQGNFIYLYFDSDDEKDKTYNQLVKAGLQVCDLKIFAQDKSLRITVADHEISERIIDCLKTK